MLLVGINGYAGSGKSTTAEMIKATFRARVGILPFAEPLKAIAREMGWDGKKDEKGRRLLQLLGTDCGRRCINENIWVNKWLVNVQQAKHDGFEIIVADDCRFLNEIATIKRLGGICINVKREGSFAGDHITERPLPSKVFHYQIHNEGDEDDLEQALLQVPELVEYPLWNPPE